MTQQLFGYKRIALLGLVTVTFLMSSCYSYKVATKAQEGSEASKTITAHSFFWGAVQKPAQITTPLCDSLRVNGMSEVTVKTNLGYALITVVTLGIWSPVKLQWKCGKPCRRIGEP